MHKTLKIAVTICLHHMKYYPVYVFGVCTELSLFVGIWYRCLYRIVPVWRNLIQVWPLDLSKGSILKLSFTICDEFVLLFGLLEGLFNNCNTTMCTLLCSFFFKLFFIESCHGCWEDGLPHEPRSLLFKALHNLLER